MTREIKKVGVIGSGVMGSGIAAQVANAKINVVLLDIEDKSSNEPNNIVKLAFGKILESQPSALSHPDHASYITIGNLENDLNLLKDCDLVIEVIIEQLELKHKLYASLIPYLNNNAIIASNTSTLPLSELKKNLPEDLKSRFVIIHFFNPPRYMELVELVIDNAIDNKTSNEITTFVTKQLGKTVVRCNDTPGFIANRVGCFLLEMVTRCAIKDDINTFFIDQIFTKFFGFPTTGIFGLYDLIGHDVMELISKSLILNLPQNDRYRDIYLPISQLDAMKSQKLLGRKTGGGFYRLNKSNGQKIKEVIDFTNLKFKPVENIENFPANLENLLQRNNKESRFITNVFEQFFNYIAGLIPDVTNNPEDIDTALKLGYNLKYGPFELFDKDINIWKNVFISNTISLMQKFKPVQKQASNIEISTILSNDSATLISENGNYRFIINTKMNSLNKAVFILLIDSIKRAEDNNKSLFICPSGNDFSAGADLKFLKELIESKNYVDLEEFLKLGQTAMMALKHSKTQVISCAYGVALGGGCEILLHSDLVIANQNLNAGLVELGICLIPAWGGTKEMFMRGAENKDKLLLGLKNILRLNKVSSGDYFASDYMINCQINMNKHLIFEQAIQAKVPYIQKNSTVTLPTIDLSKAIDSTNFDNTQNAVIEFFQDILNQQEISEQELLDKEREMFMKLATKPDCLEKIRQFV